jgi:hypothetical protein
MLNLPMFGIQDFRYVELLAWGIVFMEMQFSEAFNQAWHNMYRHALKSAFYYDSQDMPISRLQEIKDAPLYVCNATANELDDGSDRVYHPFTFSQLHIGSTATGYRRSKPHGEFLGFAMAVSGAALATSVGSLDAMYSSPLTRLSLCFLGLNLGANFRLPALLTFGNAKQNVIVISHYLLFAVKYLIFAGLIICVILKAAIGPQSVTVALQLFILIALFVPIIISYLSEMAYVIFGPVLECIRRFPVNDLDLWRNLCQIIGMNNSVGSRHIFLSDGGHFDNCGAYEMMRRQVDQIIIFDGSEDGLYTLDGLKVLLLLALKDKLLQSVNLMDAL